MAVWWRIFEFQSTLPREERPKWLVTLPPWLNFNPRSHERSDNIQNLTFALTKRYQDPLPREERLFIRGGLCENIERWRAGCVCLFVFVLRHLFVISIHAPTRGATCIRYIYIWYVYISIHAPTRGATVCPENHMCHIHISIHAPTRGATLVTHCVLLHDIIFQSTLPREERP